MGQTWQIILFAFVLSSAISISCGSRSEGSEAMSNVNKEAQKIYNNKCALCHGVKGDKQLSGAKKLTESIKTQEEIENLVTNGFRQMPKFDTQLSPEEIRDVSAYAKTFQTKQ